MATTSPTPKPPDLCDFSSGLALWGWLLLGIWASVVFVGSIGPLRERYCEQQRMKQREELARSFGPGAVDPDPDWKRALEQINESQRSLRESRAEGK
jgi:hypothetical protein